MDAIQTLKQFIEERRKNSGLRLSREIPCTYQLVRFWLRGKRRPGRRNARKLAQIMVADGFLSDAEARSFLSSLMIDDPQGKSDSGLNINILLSDGCCDDDASTSHAAPVAHLPKHTGALSGNGGGSFSGSELASRSSSPSSSSESTTRPADEPCFSPSVEFGAAQGASAGGRACPPAADGFFAEADQGGRPDSGTAAASDLKPVEGCAC
jgi:hypothetical protein